MPRLVLPGRFCAGRRTEGENNVRRPLQGRDKYAIIRAHEKREMADTMSKLLGKEQAV